MFIEPLCASLLVTTTLAAPAECAGVVAHGHLRADGTFVADEVLAKHDEKYMPPKMGEALKTHHGDSRPACRSLKKCRITGPSARTIATMIQL